MRQLPRFALICTLGAVGLGPAAASARTGLFQSPTGNIGCYISTSYTRCDIAVHDWPTPPKPANCDVDYGGGLDVGLHGRGGFVCAGDTALHQGPVLAYGKRRSAGRFTCTSRAVGMTCRNRRNGHGFFLSRQSYRRF